MREIGTRELKASLSATLRAVARGERIRVTVRGRPIADLVPAGAVEVDEDRRRLVAEGRLTPRTRSLPDRPPRLVRADRSATEIVLAERDAER
jgi:prevent-host-death family protein